MTTDLVNATALQVYCPRCSAAPHRPCRSVRGPARGRVKAYLNFEFAPGSGVRHA